MLKEKFKFIKLKLKLWHKRHGRNIDGQIVEAKDRLNVLDVRSEGVSLQDA